MLWLNEISSWLMHSGGFRRNCVAIGRRGRLALSRTGLPNSHYSLDIRCLLIGADAAGVGPDAALFARRLGRKWNSFADRCQSRMLVSAVVSEQPREDAFVTPTSLGRTGPATLRDEAPVSREIASLTTNHFANSTQEHPSPSSDPLSPYTDYVLGARELSRLRMDLLPFPSQHDGTACQACR